MEFRTNEFAPPFGVHRRIDEPKEFILNIDVRLVRDPGS